jgi:hypothetical protein
MRTCSQLAFLQEDPREDFVFFNPQDLQCDWPITLQLIALTLVSMILLNRRRRAAARCSSVEGNKQQEVCQLFGTEENVLCSVNVDDILVRLLILLILLKLVSDPG